MADISPKEEIKRSADIVELIGQYVQLKKAGRNFIGLCPFHSEKAPSFSVNPERQTFHCFGCKKGGDVFSFWMEYHSASFPEALRDLAEKYNVPISKGYSREKEERASRKRASLLEVNELAAAYFQKTLSHPKQGVPGRQYLKKRDLSDDIVARFRIGFAPDRWDGLTRFLDSRNAGSDAAVSAGLLVQGKKGRCYDRFRGRVIFPICDVRGRVVGFGGRILDDSLPKYLNSPESSVFKKGELLYGLHESAGAIRKSGRVIVVEGYLDCLALMNKGISEVVATLGTAVTENHLRRLRGYADDVLLLFDSDDAGKAAALKSLPLFSNEGISARAALLPDGHDPDSFVNSQGADELRRILEEALSLFDFYMNHRMPSDKSDTEAKVGLIKELIPVVGQMSGEAQRSLYVRRLSDRVGIKEDILWSELEGIRKGRFREARSGQIKHSLSSGSEASRFGRDMHFLNLLINFPAKASMLAKLEWSDYFSDSRIKEIVRVFLKSYQESDDFFAQDLLGHLPDESCKVVLREALSEGCFYTEEEAEQAIFEIRREIERCNMDVVIKSARKQKCTAHELNEILKKKRDLIEKTNNF